MFPMSTGSCVVYLRRLLSGREDNPLDPVVRNPLVRFLWAILVACGTVMAMMAGYIFWEIKRDIDDLPAQVAIVATEVRNLSRTVQDTATTSAVQAERTRQHEERLRQVEEQLRTVAGFRGRE